jgi:hypothetical protein
LIASYSDTLTSSSQNGQRVLTTIATRLIQRRSIASTSTSCAKRSGSIKLSLVTRTIWIRRCHGLESLLPQHAVVPHLGWDDTAYPALALFMVTHLHILFVASHNTTSVQSFNSSCKSTPTEGLYAWSCRSLKEDLQQGLVRG